jgi:hypothetical protein
MNFLNQIFLSSQNTDDNIDDLLDFFKPFYFSTISEISPHFTGEATKADAKVAAKVTAEVAAKVTAEVAAKVTAEVAAELPISINIKKERIYDQKNDQIIPRIREKQYTSPTKDSLFWSIFISKYGYKEFLVIGNKYHNRELEEKHKIIDFMKKTLISNDKKTFLQTHKITNVFVQEVISDLMTNTKTTLKSAILICIYYRIRIFLVTPLKKTYLEFCPFSYEDTSTINVNERGLYNVETDASFQNILDKYVLLEHGDKPLKGLSSYKTADLEIIANKLDINIYHNEKKWKKAELYDLIMTKM